MDIAEAFRFHGDKIVNRWVEYTLSTYSSSSFFIKEGDKFANPVGGNFREGLKKLFLLLTGDGDVKEFSGPLEQIISIRSVQEFTPAQAVAPINAVKHIVREAFEGDKERSRFISELYDFEFRVDLAVLAAFDIYMSYRERLYQVRIDEIKSGRQILTDSKCPSAMLAENKKVIKTVNSF
ncbi:RsbRD N-terminal domain-containing protein [Desulfomarina sp.]